ncbi:hypothetical protein CB1_000072013 [Camelus ferus]|nr:hypothetical protein CB1_000072013 [Camelus ferus]
MECGEVVRTGAGWGQDSSAPSGLTDNPQARLIVVVEVDQGRRSGPEETYCRTLLLEGPESICLLQRGTQEQCITFDRVLGSYAAEEAEQELLARAQSTLGRVGQGYSVALLLRGRETEAPRLVPQLLQMLFEEALPLRGSDAVLSTLSLVQLSPSGRTQDLLAPGAENLSVLDVAPLGLVVVNATEVEVSDSRAASELYLQAAVGEGRACSLLTITMSCPGPDPSEGPGTQSMWQGALRILQLPGVLQLPELAPGCTVGGGEKEDEGEPGLLGDTLTESGLSQLGRALRELQVVKAWSQRLGSWMLKEVKAEAAGLPEPRAQQAPDVALQFFLAQARRQRLRERHQIWIQEEMKHLEQEKEEVAGDQVKGLGAREEPSKERHRWHREQAALRLQLEALQAERDAAEQDLVALYDLYVQAARARTCHVLQVFRAWRGLWEERAVTTEHHYRSLLAGVLQDTISLATQNQELQAQNQQLWQTRLEAVMLDSSLEEKPGN